MTAGAHTPPQRSRGHASPARRCALTVLRRVFAEGAYADRALRAEAERAGLEGRERALAERLAFGAVQRRMTLDHVITACSKRPLGQIEASLLDALRLGVLQLVHLDTIPDHAAVEQTVELVREAVGDRATGFANAVMRRAAREVTALVGALDDAEPAGAALRHSHPEWIVRLWWDALGATEARALLAHDNEPSESTLRVNELVATPVEALASLRRAGVAAHLAAPPPAAARADPAQLSAAQSGAAHPAPQLDEAIVLEGRLDLARSPLFRSGAVTPQSRASMLVARVAAPQPGERVLDLCAAPGAKTTHLAALMANRGSLVAVEHHPGRAAALAENCRRLHAEHVEVVTADARDAQVGTGYDRVLLDPPCSDLGTLAARPDARWRKSPEQVAGLTELGAELLAAAARRVRPGGTLTFSTCTISPAENAGQVTAFLGAHDGFSADDLSVQWPGLADRAAPAFLQTLPHRDATAGFFVARLRRRA